MPKEATGELKILADGFAARITIIGRKRKDFPLPFCRSETDARERCSALASMAARLRRAKKTAEEMVSLISMGAKAKAGHPWEFVRETVDLEAGGQLRRKGAAEVPTFATWAKDWTSGALAKKHPDHVRVKRTADRDAELLKLYILPHLEGIAVDAFTLAHAEFVMASLPADRSAGTRRHVAQVMARLMRLAVYPGKWRQDNPIPSGWLPRAGDPKAKECLYPDEDATLLGGKSVQTTTGAASGRTSRSCAGSPTAFSRARACAPTRWSRSAGATSTWSVAA